MARTGKSIGLSELRVGIFTLVALAILVFFILNASGNFNPFERKFHLKARFGTADGLREGAEVQLAGMPIGKVEDVRLLPPGDESGAKVEARLTVSPKVDGQAVSDRIRTDSTAQLVAQNILGNDKVIDITPGTSAGSPVAENHVLESVTPATINQLTVSGNDLVQQLNKLALPVTDIASKINQGEGTAGKLINDEALYNSLNATISEAQGTVNQLKATISKVNTGNGTAGKLLNDPQLYNNVNQTTDKLNQTVAQLQAISNDLRAGRGTAGKFLKDEALYNNLNATVADSRESIAKLNAIADKFTLIVNDINEGKGTAGKLLKDEALYNDARSAIARFNTTAERVDNIVSVVERGEGTAGKLLRDDALYNNVNQLTTEGNKLIYDFRQNPKRYLTIQLKLF